MKKLVLIVEDEQDMIDCITEFLYEAEVHPCDSITRAMQHIALNDYNFIIIDQFLTKEFGLDLVNTLPYSLRRKIILLTSDQDTLNKAIKIGCLSFDKMGNLANLADFINNSFKN